VPTTAKMPATADVTTTATKVTATAAEMTATTTAAASGRRGSGTDQNDRQNDGQEIEFRHGTLEERGLR
jgi:hypothetical protein